MTILRLGAEDIVVTAPTLNDDHFGAVQTGFGQFDDYKIQFDYLGAGHVRWPGGTLSEVQTDVYALDQHGLFDGTQLFTPDPNRKRPDLTDMFDFANSRDIGVSIQIPTARYANDPSTAQVHLGDFLLDLETGVYGPLPDEILFEIGNEYYALPEFQHNPGAYANLVNSMVSTINTFLRNTQNGALADALKIGVQIGRTQSDNDAILGNINPSTLSSIDFLIAHHLPYRFEAVDRPNHTFDTDGKTQAVTKTELISALLSDWREKAVTQGSNWSGFEYHLTGWTIGEANPNLSVNYNYQDIGGRQGSAALELFTSHLGIGMSAACLWGVGVINNPNYFSTVENGNAEYSPGGEIFKLMAENLQGMRLLEGYTSSSRTDNFGVYSFRDMDSFATFITANDIDDNGEVITLELSAFGDISTLEITSVTYTLDPTMPTGTTYPEARKYEIPISTTTTYTNPNKQIDLPLSQDFEVILLKGQISDEQGAETHFFGFGAADSQTGSSADDFIFNPTDTQKIDGGDGDDVLTGGLGNEIIFGGGGDDVLVGDINSLVFGNDVLDGEAGNDLLMGGGGADTFVFRPNDGTDIIASFLIDYTNTKNAKIVGRDFYVLVDSVFWVNFGYETRKDILENFSEINGNAVFSDQGTTVTFWGVGLDELSELSAMFL